MLVLQYRNVWGGSDEKCQDIPTGFEYAKKKQARTTGTSRLRQRLAGRSASRQEGSIQASLFMLYVLYIK